MQDDCLFDCSVLLVHINAAREAAEASARAISTLHERAVLAESQVRICEARYAQKVAEHAAVVEQLQQCQLDCDLLKQQVLALHDELVFEEAALTAEAQERESLQHQLESAHTTVHQLERQLALNRTCCRTVAVQADLQHRLQELRGQLAATNCNTQSLQQHLQQDRILLQQYSNLLTAVGESQVAPHQHDPAAQPSHQQQQQPLHEFASLSAQVVNLVDTSGEVSALKAALEQQLHVSKAQIVQLHQKLAQAASQNKQQHQHIERSDNTVRDRSYYKRKYHELLQKNAVSEAELQQLQQQKEQLWLQQQQRQQGQQQQQQQQRHFGTVSEPGNDRQTSTSLNTSRQYSLAADDRKGASCARILNTSDHSEQQLGGAQQETNTATGAAAAAAAATASAVYQAVAARAAVATASTAAVDDNIMHSAKRRKPAAAAGDGACPVSAANPETATARNDGTATDTPAAAVGVTTTAAAAAAAAGDGASSSESLQVTSQPEPTQATQQLTAAVTDGPNSHQYPGPQHPQGREHQAQARELSPGSNRSTPAVATDGAAAAAACEQALPPGIQCSQPGSPTAAAEHDSELGHAAAVVTQGTSSSSPGEVQSHRRKAVQRGGRTGKAKKSPTKVVSHSSGAGGSGAALHAGTGGGAAWDCAAAQRPQNDARQVLSGCVQRQQQQQGGGVAAVAADSNGPDSRQQQQQQPWAGHDTDRTGAWKTVRARRREASTAAATAATGVSSRHKQVDSLADAVPAAAACCQATAGDSNVGFILVRSQQQKASHGASRAKQKPSTDVLVAAAEADQGAAADDDGLDLCMQLSTQQAVRLTQPMAQQQQQQSNKNQQHQTFRNGGSSTGVQQMQAALPGQQQSRSCGDRKHCTPASLQQGYAKQGILKQQKQKQQQQQLVEADGTMPNVPAAVVAPAAGVSTAACARPAAIQQQQHAAGRTGVPARSDTSGTPAVQQLPGLQRAAAAAAAVAALPTPQRTISGVCSAALQGSTEVGPGAAAAAAETSAPVYKYQEVVRKKADRELLPAFECDACRTFYGAVQSWGATAVQQLGLPSCGHAAPGTRTATAAVGGQQQQQAGGAVQRIVQDASRHRAKWKPPSTPVGFWDIGFTQDTAGARYQDSP